MQAGRGRSPGKLRDVNGLVEDLKRGPVESLSAK